MFGGFEVIEDDGARIRFFNAPGTGLHFKHHRRQRHRRGIPGLSIDLGPGTRPSRVGGRSLKYDLSGDRIMPDAPECVISRVERGG